MLNYKFEDKDINSICEEYNIDKSKFENILDEVGTFYSNVRVQHLSSIMRSLEIKGRHITKNNSFRIDWGEMKNDSEDAHSMWKDGRFIIFLPKNTKDDEKARYIVAHELGELFYLLEMIKESNSSTQNEQELKNLIKEKCNNKAIASENHKKANIFGIAIIQERSYFYKNKVPSMDNMVNKPVEEIMKYFKQK